ncbi:MAG: Unknown protein [uncultured Sulfurovum sp.]|uniref:Fibronectin type-III domain-containing protein n=1 Tax=uncultured Sulfurovum sp. TaxID=269237 RepID=A0A6S6SPH3_9BACT|nr:MAG: Unknown protein [uncultured Sulfurovum sp.]
MFKYRKGLFISLLASLALISSLVEAATVPNAPGGYTAVSPLTDTSVRISTQDNSNNEDGFYTSVYDHATSALVKREQVSGSNKSHTYANIEGLECDKLYSVNVIAFNNEGNSSASDTAHFNINNTFSTPCLRTPTAPGPYIGVTGIDTSSVRVNFLDNSNNEDGFLVFDNTGDINVTVPVNSATEPSQTYVTLTGLECSRTYKIKVLAFNAYGNSGISEEKAFNINRTFNIACNNTCVAKTDSFTYEKDTNASLKADILFVMDDSGSMGSIQNGVASSVSSTFGNVMNSFGIDWKATVIGTERNRGYLTKHIDNPSINDIAQLSSQLRLGTFGGDEVGLLRAYEYLSNADITIRDDAKLSMVLITDEVAHTTLPELGGIADINDSYFVQNKIKVSSIIRVAHQNNSNLAYQMANVTGGIVADINAANFDILMTQIAQNAAGGASKIELEETPCDINNIEVLINGVVVTSGWIYNVNSNSIVFDTTSTIQNQDQVTVNYSYLTQSLPSS